MQTNTSKGRVTIVTEGQGMFDQTGDPPLSDERWLQIMRQLFRGGELPWFLRPHLRNPEWLGALDRLVEQEIVMRADDELRWHLSSNGEVLASRFDAPQTWELLSASGVNLGGVHKLLSGLLCAAMPREEFEAGLSQLEGVQGDNLIAALLCDAVIELRDMAPQGCAWTMTDEGRYLVLALRHLLRAPRVVVGQQRRSAVLVPG